MADLVAAAALWRHRFLLQAKGDNSDSNLTDGSERSDVQSEPSVESAVVSADEQASTNRKTDRSVRGRQKSVGGCQRIEHTVPEQKTEVHPLQAHESKQEENLAEEPAVPEKSYRRKSDQRAVERGRRSTRAKQGSASEEEERVEEPRGVEKTCRDTAESSGSAREKEEKNETVKRNSEPEEVEMDEDKVRQTAAQEDQEKNHEDSTPSSASLQTLESWQQSDFCIEDVLKPVVKSRGSVRRSLRHRGSMDEPAKGLAWVEHTSPQMITTTQRRRMRGRLSAVSQPPDSGETPSERPATAAQL